MPFNELIRFIKSDLYQYAGKTTAVPFLRNLIFAPGFKYSFWMRLSAYFAHHRFFKHSLFFFSAIMLAHYRDKYGIEIAYVTQVGSGLHIVHPGGIVVTPEAVVGNNCVIFHGVTIGMKDFGKRIGAPIIGDNVFIGPGAKIIGNVNIGNYAFVGANCVVTKDVPDHATVVGIPGKVIGYSNSEGFAAENR